MKTLSIPTLNSIIQDVHRADLTVEQLEDLSYAINSMLSLRRLEEYNRIKDGSFKQNPEQEAIAPANAPISGKRRGEGCYEIKTIKGHQYLYLRYYKGCRNGRSVYGSKYLGKANANPSA